MTPPTVPQPELKGVFDDRGRVRWVPVEQASASDQAPDVEGGAADDGVVDDVHSGENATVPPPADLPVPPPTAQTFDALQKQIQDLTQTVSLLAQTQLKGIQPQPQQPQAPQPPDPTQFDFYEPSQVAEFHRLNNDFIRATVQQSVQSALAPHQDAMQSAEYSRQYNSVLAEHGASPNFKPLMDKALQVVAQSNGRFSIPEAYNFVASSQISSSPHQPAAASQPVKQAQRPITREEAERKAQQAASLPQRNGVSGTGEPALPSTLNNVGALGRIMLHNQQTGRARPV
jgi:hypothetical protein